MLSQNSEGCYNGMSAGWGSRSTVELDKFKRFLIEGHGNEDVQKDLSRIKKDLDDIKRMLSFLMSETDFAKKYPDIFKVFSKKVLI